MEADPLGGCAREGWVAVIGAMAPDGAFGLRGTYRRLYGDLKSGMVSCAVESDYPPEFVAMLAEEIPDAVDEGPPNEPMIELRGEGWAGRRRGRSMSFAASTLRGSSMRRSSTLGAWEWAGGDGTGDGIGEGESGEEDATYELGAWEPLSDRARKRQMVDAMRARLDGGAASRGVDAGGIDEGRGADATSESTTEVFEPWGPIGRWTVGQVAGWAARHGLDPRRVAEYNVDGIQLAKMGCVGLRVVFDLPLLMAAYVRGKVQEALAGPRSEQPRAEDGVWSEFTVTQWHIHEKQAEMDAELIGTRSYRWRSRWLRLAARYGVRPASKRGPDLGPGQYSGLNVEEILHVFTLLLQEGAETVPEDAAFIAADIDMMLPEIRAYNEEASVGARDDTDVRQTMEKLKRAVGRILKSSGRLFWAGPEWNCGRDRMLRMVTADPVPDGPIELLPPEWERMMLRIVPHLCHQECVEVQIRLLREAIRGKWDDIHALFHKYKVLDHWMPEPEATRSAVEGDTDVLLVENFWAFCKDARVSSQKVTLGDINRGCLPELESHLTYSALIGENSANPRSKGKTQVSEIQKRWNSFYAHEIGCHGSRRGVLDVVQFGECMIRIAFFHSIGSKTKRRGTFGMGYNAVGSEARLDQHFVLFTEHHYVPMCLSADESYSSTPDSVVQHAEPLDTIEKWLLEFPIVQHCMLKYWKLLWLLYCQFKDTSMVVDGNGLTKWLDKAEIQRGPSRRDMDTMTFNDFYVIIFHVVEEWPGHGLTGKNLAGMAQDITGFVGIMGQVHQNNAAVELTFIEFIRLMLSVSAFLYHEREKRKNLDKRFREAPNEPARVLIIFDDLVGLFKTNMFPSFPFALPKSFD